MSFLTGNSGEPFGLPAGTVRGLIAIAFSAVTLDLWVTGQVVPDALLGVTTLIVGNYFGSRTAAEATTAAVAVESVKPPYIPGEVTS